MALRGTDPKLYTTEYTSLYEEKRSGTAVELVWHM